MRSHSTVLIDETALPDDVPALRTLVRRQHAEMEQWQAELWEKGSQIRRVEEVPVRVAAAQEEEMRLAARLLEHGARVPGAGPLQLLGLPIQEDVAGKVLTGLLRSSPTPLRVDAADDPPDIPELASFLCDTPRAPGTREVEKRLRALGYTE